MKSRLMVRFGVSHSLRQQDQLGESAISELEILMNTDSSREVQRMAYQLLTCLAPCGKRASNDVMAPVRAA